MPTSCGDVGPFLTDVAHPVDVKNDLQQTSFDYDVFYKCIKTLLNTVCNIEPQSKPVVSPWVAGNFKLGVKRDPTERNSSTETSRSRNQPNSW